MRRKVPAPTVPYGVDDAGRLVAADAAQRSVTYRCPSCDAALVLRKGPVRVAHFAHPSNNSCDGESLLHLLAKSLIVQVVNDWRSSRGPAPVIERKCRRCGEVEHLQLPHRIASAVPEYRVGDRWIVDAALLGATGVAVAAVEIRATHAVGDEKAEGLSMPIAELLAEDVLASPLLWKPLEAVARPYTCDSCKAAQEAERRHLDEVGKRNGQPLPGPPYQPAVYPCWRCGAETIVYNWQGHRPFTDAAPPAPRPPTIRLKYSRTVGRRYWANNCARCGTIQGDHHLFHEPDGPFFGQAEYYEEEDGEIDLESAIDFVFPSPFH